MWLKIRVRDLERAMAFCSELRGWRFARLEGARTGARTWPWAWVRPCAYQLAALGDAVLDGRAVLTGADASQFQLASVAEVQRARGHDAFDLNEHLSRGNGRGQRAG
jgi:hypothetical protein